jgi:hypothetical protein
MRPILASGALRQQSPRKTYGSNFPALKNYSARELSPMRPRTRSVKRKPDEAFSYASVASTRAVRQICPEKVETLTVNISTVTSLCDKVDTALAAESGPLKEILSDLSAAMRLINSNHEVIIKEQISAPQKSQPSGLVNIGTIPKRNRPNVQVPELVIPSGDNVFSDAITDTIRMQQHSRKNLSIRN